MINWYYVDLMLPWVALGIAVAALVLAIKAVRHLRYHDEVISRIVERQNGSDGKREH